MKPIKKDKVIGILAILAILAFFGILTVTIGKDVVALASDPVKFQEWIETYGILGQGIMTLLVFLQVVIAWLPGEIFEVGAGYAFGFWQGSFLVLLGSFFASGLVMILVKKFGRNLVYRFFPKEKVDALPFLHNQKKLDKFIFIAFLIPGTPKDILTYAVGLTDMKVSHFLLLSTIGRIPSVITSTITGSALGLQNYSLAIFSFVFTMIISLLGLWIYGIITKHQQKKCIA